MPGRVSASEVFDDDAETPEAGLSFAAAVAAVVVVVGDVFADPFGAKAVVGDTTMVLGCGCCADADDTDDEEGNDGDAEEEDDEGEGSGDEEGTEARLAMACAAAAEETPPTRVGTLAADADAGTTAPALTHLELDDAAGSVGLLTGAGAGDGAGAGANTGARMVAAEMMRFGLDSGFIVA
jgi:hypothetical protein